MALSSFRTWRRYCDDSQFRHSQEYNTACPCDRCQQAATQDIIHIACILNRMLPADIIPAILEYAGIQRRLDLPRTYEHRSLAGYKNPFIKKGFEIPVQIPRGAIRQVRIRTTTSRTRIRGASNLNMPIPGEEETWIEAVATGLDGDNGQKQDGHSSTTQKALVATALGSSSEYGSKRLVSYTDKGRLFQRAFWTSWNLESEDQDIRRIMKELRGGSTIEIRLSTRPRPYTIFLAATVIIEYAVVTKM